MHGDEIDVVAWSWDADNSGSTRVPSGADTGEANFQDISFTKYLYYFEFYGGEQLWSI